MTDERHQELKAGKEKLTAEARDYGVSEAKRYCESASYEDLAGIADLEPDADGRYQFAEGEELDFEGFPTRMHGEIEAAFVAEVTAYLDNFERTA